MNQFTRTITIPLSLLLLTLSPLETFAQPSEAVLVKYDKDTGIPDEVMLPTFVQIIANTRLEEEHEGHNHGARLIQRKLAIESYDEADALLDYFVSISNRISSDKDLFIREHICSFDRSRPSGVAVLEKMNAADDNHDIVGARYLEQIESHLSEQAYSLFLQWMAEQKLGTMIVKFDHKYIHKNRQPDMVRQEVCGRFDSVESSAQRRNNGE